MKKIIIIMIALVLFTSAAFAYNNSFTDISNHWGKDYVTALTDKGIIAGYKESNGTYTFRPDKNITVAEFIVLVMKSQDQMVEPVTSGYWATPWINKAYDLGYIDDTYKNFDKYITREEMAEIAYNAISKNEYMSRVDEKYLLDYVKDYASISEYKKDKVTSIYTMGIMSGTPEKKFVPLGSATRAEASVVVSRIIDPSIRKPIEFDVPSFNYKTYEYDWVTASMVYREGIAFAKTDKNGILQDEIVRAYELWRKQITDFYTEELNDPNIEADRKEELQTTDWDQLVYLNYGDNINFGGFYKPNTEQFSVGCSELDSNAPMGIIGYSSLDFYNFAFEGRNYPYHLEFDNYDDFEAWKLNNEKYMMPYYEMLFEDDTQMILNLAYEYMKKAPTDAYLQADKFNNYREVFTLKNGREISFFINKDGVSLNIGLDNK